ncbi:Uncharacterised protein [Shigella sonnei]|nr:Uncharacterised protein [Shigella sonnei]SJF75114.1 Uncharacterised protein [Shigella sonnei]
MIILMVAKVCIYPAKQIKCLNIKFGAVCLLYNKTLHVMKHVYQR